LQTKNNFPHFIPSGILPIFVLKFFSIPPTFQAISLIILGAILGAISAKEFGIGFESQLIINKGEGMKLE